MKEKRDILKMTFDNMNMSEERSEEIKRELINYNIGLADKEEKEAMKERKIKVSENLHEISPENGKKNRWRYVLGSICVLAVAVFGIIIWHNTDFDNGEDKKEAGYDVLSDGETRNQVADNNGTIADEKKSEASQGEQSQNINMKSDRVYYTEKGDDMMLSSAIIPTASSKFLIYEVEKGDINMRLAEGYNYNLYSRQTDNGLEMLAVGVRMEGDTYHYVYSKQLREDDDTVAETCEEPETVSGKTPVGQDYPDFMGVSFTAGEKYTGSREELISELSEFYNTVNEFIESREVEEPDVSYKQFGVEGELDEGIFEYKILQEAEAAYVTCGVKDPIDFRLEGYFEYLDGEIGQ